MEKQVVIYVWDGDKMLGYSKIGNETEWVMDLPGASRTLAKMTKLTCTDESIDSMIIETEKKNGQVYRFTIDETENTWAHFYKIR